MLVHKNHRTLIFFYNFNKKRFVEKVKKKLYIYIFKINTFTLLLYRIYIVYPVDHLFHLIKIKCVLFKDAENKLKCKKVSSS